MPEGRLTESRTGFGQAAVGPDAVGLLARVDFEGSWDVRRLIVDHLSGAVHRFEGTAIVSASAFVEAGVVRYGATAFKANRRYTLAPGIYGPDVAFPDGRPFISLGEGASQSVRHLCGADDYRGRFFFRDGNAWVEAWRVTGPRKRYASLAHYRRQDVAL